MGRALDKQGHRDAGMPQFSLRVERMWGSMQTLIETRMLRVVEQRTDRAAWEDAGGGRLRVKDLDEGARLRGSGVGGVWDCVG